MTRENNKEFKPGRPQMELEWNSVTPARSGVVWPLSGRKGRAQ